ncbi:L-aspartate oxidase [Leptolyngbya cf. ectocarpi LEGE 11479]|uniref:L-aspartate oxidase n=1 Tax=Leptolyngbya cf. ectocarpi LEGE 11479 TaxID=1828722 RepID=A0A928WZY8_LEPEC|nr:L-aspartate oxidase [Leptolyngbya ectocarpi]MBE9065331.1 L-aspartate oxidase [Leptolyngbya cf. ectocarpi LEGE 11479]
MHSSPSPSLLPSRFDVLVVGGGAAGLYSALCLPTTLHIGLITKDTLSISASDWAQGGIAAAIAPDDDPELHIIDTLKAGAGLCDRNAVEVLVRQADDCIQNLTQMGVAFDRQGDQLAMTLEAAHSRRRVLHAADTTGRAVVTTLAAQVLERPNIHVFNQALALDLWMHNGECRGVQLVYEQQLYWVEAKAVVLATGGGGQIYSQTTNPAASTGDGVAMAWRAGAQLRDLEFMQFHPTALTKEGAPRFLISEAVRGEGAHLIDSTGRRFAFDYHPDGELAPRDIVSRAIFNHLQKTPGESVVYLDLRVIEPERVQHRFPNIIRKCQKWAGINVFETPIPVSPAAHYWMGGITTNLNSQTTIPRLYAVGENASTGVHGANRLASNSLLECLVFGAQLQEISPEPLESAPISANADSNSLATLPALDDDIEWLQQHRTAISQLVWQSAGIAREASSMTTALEQLGQWQTEFDLLAMSKAISKVNQQIEHPLPAQLTVQTLRLWTETRNLLAVAILVLKSALFRTESRGGHYRSDYPEKDPAWQVHTLLEDDHWVRSHPIQPNASGPLT